jgi:hypothetical protein
MRAVRLVLALAALGLVGCGDDDDDGAVCGDGLVTGEEVCDDGTNDALGGGCQPGCAASDDSDLVFDRDLIDIEIELPAADWEELRHQYKSRHSTFGEADCRSTPGESPYTWFAASVTIDGTRLEDVGLRKKGHLGSQSTLRPGLKLKFDELVDGQSLLGLGRLALNNNRSDGSYVRTCVAYRIFAAAGVPTPRCTYATVSVNGEPLGVYTAVEEIGKPYLARRFDDAEGNLYEGTASDFLPDYVGGFEQETNEKSDPSRADLAAVQAALEDAADDELLAQLAPLVSLDDFFTYWAVETLIWFSDGYSGNANNFFLYADPGDGGRFRFLPWGPDTTLRADTRAEVPDAVMAFSALNQRIYGTSEGRARYYETLGALVDAWDPSDHVAEIERITDLVEPYLAADVRDDQPALAAEVSEFLENRQDDLAAAIAEDPDWDAGLRTTPCRTPVSAISGSFTTTWGTLSTNVFTAGDGSLSTSLHGAPIDVAQVGARAGFLSSGRGRMQMQVDLAGGTRSLAILVTFPDEDWFDPFMRVGDYLLQAPPITMTVSELDTTTDPDTTLEVYEIGEGTWTFTAIDTDNGDAVAGSFSGTLYSR